MVWQPVATETLFGALNAAHRIRGAIRDAWHTKLRVRNALNLRCNCGVLHKHKRPRCFVKLWGRVVNALKDDASKTKRKVTVRCCPALPIKPPRLTHGRLAKLLKERKSASGILTQTIKDNSRASE